MRILLKATKSQCSDELIDTLVPRNALSKLSWLIACDTSPGLEGVADPILPPGQILSGETNADEADDEL